MIFALILPHGDTGRATRKRSSERLSIFIRPASPVAQRRKHLIYYLSDTGSYGRKTSAYNEGHRPKVGRVGSHRVACAQRQS